MDSEWFHTVHMHMQDTATLVAGVLGGILSSGLTISAANKAKDEELIEVIWPGSGACILRTDLVFCSA